MGRRVTRRGEDHEHEEDQKVKIFILFFILKISNIACILQKRGKRRWILRKPSNHQERVIQHYCEEATKPGTSNADDTSANDRHAIAVAIATTTAAQAAIATAKAAAEVARLAMLSSFVKQHFAVIIIQTALRGYQV
ncbi:protein IQ-DOMAIN 1-like [Tripterygium wilfordii]|uniref:Protein IQ-DOMAIN 1-like n=1 Tax=Tripterygium wilfordii TaxID=458696 RepID=A0A7J7CAW3_TRIWF|nr:protein IQ-DOMAIN 1-like [Tripterygium wilfordii]